MSLMEVVVALSLLALVLPLLLNLFPSSLKSLRRAECLQTATTLAAYRMDEAGLIKRVPGKDLEITVDLTPYRYKITREFYAVDAYRMDCTVVVSPLENGLNPIKLETRFMRDAP